LDTIKRALEAISAGPEAAEVNGLHQDTMRVRFAEMQRVEARQARKAAVSGEPLQGLRPWREIIQPHPDVAKGNFSTSEFAADLAAVHRGGAPEEYGDPKAFFRRTYLTEGLRTLLQNAIKRLNGKGGHPVIELQTNFGGGKTHSMLALYHLVSPGVKAGDLMGVDALLAEAEVGEVPEAQRAVLVGTALSPSKPEMTKEGLELRTLWGRMAYQLAGAEGYAVLAACDETGTAPGSDDLVKLFELAGPSVILIDEWVAYVRVLYDDKQGLAAGTFDANLTFAQALTEAVKACPRVLLIASLPQSNIEVGGEGGAEALKRLENTFARLEFNWQPANQDESYEIVRRRLFETISVDLLPARDTVVAGYADMYFKNKEEFPPDAQEHGYLDKLQSAYPIHPEVFDRLYQDWSRLEQFQRTRGVLRLMAETVHKLWVSEDRSLMIMPCHLPFNEQEVRDELTRHSGTAKSQWDSIIEHDIDGPRSIPMSLDKENPRFGKVSAARRVARCLFMGSAPVGDSGGRGIDIRRVRLGCVQPGENTPVFVDATRALADKSSHLYLDQGRYWYDDQPNVNRTAEDRANQIGREPDKALDEIRERLKEQAKKRGIFYAVHVCPELSSDVPDDRPARLVILDPKFGHNRANDDSPAASEAKIYLDRRGNSPRLYKNALIFVAADGAKVASLTKAACEYLAWSSIVKESAELDLTASNERMAVNKAKAADQAVDILIQEVYAWMLVPRQESAMEAIVLQEFPQKGGDAFSERAYARLAREGRLHISWAGSGLRQAIDKAGLWQDKSHILVKDLADYFARYPYLDRLAGTEVLLNAIQDAVSQLNPAMDGLAYADGYDTSRQRYRGLTMRDTTVHPRADGDAVVVNPEISLRQLEAEKTFHPETAPANGAGTSQSASGITSSHSSTSSSGAQDLGKRRFYGVVELDPTRTGRDAGRIADEVLSHLITRSGARVEVTLEIQGQFDEAVEEAIQRVVSENCSTLKFKDFGFDA
jgi:hypothetical protein